MMSAVAHIRAALSHAAFDSSRIQEAVDHLMETLDRDLDRTAYAPSQAALESVRELVKVLKKTGRGPATTEDDDHDVDRLS
jgi:hypothetical protein